ncbi:hypothetical protein PVAG01_08473 [Phlyctema vagabunda]|uniref:2EXR domain-containing protein n=1 Tax=Phlyctema vagabunda TaxID=108571 RepID=A0ABR4P9I8_9HELO
MAAQLTWPSDMEGTDDTSHTTITIRERAKPPEPVFTRFSELATELRLKIWRYLIPESRIVDVEVYEQYFTSGPLEYSLVGWRRLQYQLVARNHWNSIAMVNWESREQYLKKYTKKFNREDRLPRTRIDPLGDILYLRDACWCNALPIGRLSQRIESLSCGMAQELRRSIQHIAVPFKDCHHLNFGHLFRVFPALRKFTLVMNPSKTWHGAKNTYPLFIPDSEGMKSHDLPILQHIEETVQIFWRTHEGKAFFRERGFKPIFTVKWIAYGTH